MTNESSPGPPNESGPGKVLHWLARRRLIANLIWLATANRDLPLPPKPEHENLFSKPVAWLLGRQVLSAVKWMLLSAAYQGRLDPRNWMKPNRYSFPDPESGGEFWFDYLADCGDGQKAMYSIAYLCMSDLWADGSMGHPPKLGSSLSFKNDPKKLHMPRGEFLFVGGDTAYHIADYPTLAFRFQLPFYWAATDLGIGNHAKRRPIFAIPGNHDYYDEIEGFHRQFRKPITDEDAATQETTTKTAQQPQLRIPGFKRCQEASYIAIELPYQWWLWGLDSETGDLGTRQREFFKQLGKVPDKLIVATSQPTTFMGRYLDENANLSKVFQDLELRRPFLEVPEPLPAGTCRLDIAGDIHRYARYWGPPLASSPVDVPFNDNYASVVSGLGGAVVHPWESRSEDILEQVIYPTTKVSRMEVARELLNPWKLVTGGGLWLLGALLALIIFVGGGLHYSSKNAIDALFLEGILGIEKEEQLEISSPFWPLTGRLTKTTARLTSGISIKPFLHSVLILASLVPLVIAVLFGTYYSKRLKEKVKERQVMSWEYWPSWVVYAVAIVLPELALWEFGEYQIFYVVSDITFMIVVVAGLVGLIYLAVGVGAKRLSATTRIVFVLLGISHALVQVVLPFLFVRLAGPLVVILTIATMALFAGLGLLLTRLNASRWFYLVVWLGYAAITLALPLVFSQSTAQVPKGWLIPWFLLIAGVVGMINLSIWFGWYLLVSLAFSGHNDEAAGATRIEKYKQFIRFRLTPHELTAFVIGVDVPGINGPDLNPKIIDVFSIRP